MRCRTGVFVAEAARRSRLASIGRDNRARASIIRIRRLERSFAFRFRGAGRGITGRERDVARFRNGSRNADTTARVSITRVPSTRVRFLARFLDCY